MHYAQKLLKSSLIVVSLWAMVAGAVQAALPQKQDGVYVIHLEQHNGYFAARETLADLQPGKYKFVVSNKAGKVVGFQLQNHRTHELLDMFPLEPGQTKATVVTIGEDGVRYRCPINPTPWYAVTSIKTD